MDADYTFTSNLSRKVKEEERRWRHLACCFLHPAECNGKRMQIRCRLKGPSSDPRPWGLQEELDNKKEKSEVKKITDTLAD